MPACLDVDKHFLKLRKMTIERTGFAPDLFLRQLLRSFQPFRKGSVPVILTLAIASRKSEQKRAIFGNAALREGSDMVLANHSTKVATSDRACRWVFAFHSPSFAFSLIRFSASFAIEVSF